MKTKFTLLMILLFAAIFSTQAQPPRRTVEERVKQTIGRISDSLNLSTAQQGDAQATFTEYYTSMDKLREGLEPGKRPEKANMDKISDIRDSKLKIILTEDQFKKYKEMEAAMRQRNSQRPGGQ